MRGGLGCSSPLRRLHVSLAFPALQLRETLRRFNSESPVQVSGSGECVLRDAGFEGAPPPSLPPLLASAVHASLATFRSTRKRARAWRWLRACAWRRPAGRPC